MHKVTVRISGRFFQLRTVFLFERFLTGRWSDFAQVSAQNNKTVRSWEQSGDTYITLQMTVVCTQQAVSLVMDQCSVELMAPGHYFMHHSGQLRILLTC